MMTTSVAEFSEGNVVKTVRDECGVPKGGRDSHRMRVESVTGHVERRNRERRKADYDMGELKALRTQDNTVKYEYFLLLKRLYEDDKFRAEKGIIDELSVQYPRVWRGDLPVEILE